jgi:hypothetical protein
MCIDLDCLVQSLLPPCTARVGVAVAHLINASDIQPQHRCIRAIHVELPNPIRSWPAVLGKACDKLLERNRNGTVDCCRPSPASEVRIGDILSMNSWRDGKEIRVGLVAVCCRQIVGVAGEDALGDDQIPTCELSSVRVGAVKDRTKPE